MEKYRRRIPTIDHLHPRSPMCMCLRKPPTRPGQPQRTHKPLRSVPGITRDSRTSACPPPDAPRPGHHVGYRILWADGWWFGVTVVPGVTVGEPGPRTWPWLGGRLSGATGGMAVDGQWNGRSILRTNP